jgi:hypothetical protein
VQNAHTAWLKRPGVKILQFGPIAQIVFYQVFGKQVFVNRQHMGHGKVDLGFIQG